MSTVCLRLTHPFGRVSPSSTLLLSARISFIIPKFFVSVGLPVLSPRSPPHLCLFRSSLPLKRFSLSANPTIPSACKTLSNSILGAPLGLFSVPFMFCLRWHLQPQFIYAISSCLPLRQLPQITSRSFIG